jgi:hypothetical protein
MSVYDAKVSWKPPFSQRLHGRLIGKTRTDEYPGVPAGFAKVRRGSVIHTLAPGVLTYEQN